MLKLVDKFRLVFCMKTGMHLILILLMSCAFTEVQNLGKTVCEVAVDKKMTDYIPAKSSFVNYNYNQSLNVPNYGLPGWKFDPEMNYGAGICTSAGEFTVWLGEPLDGPPKPATLEAFASNESDGLYRKWIAKQLSKVQRKKLVCDPTIINCVPSDDAVGNPHFAGDDSDGKICQVPFGTQVQPNVDISGWKYGFLPGGKLDLDFTDGIKGEIGVMSVGNNKGMGVPTGKGQWSDNVSVVMDQKLGKNVLSMKTILRKSSEGKWVVKDTGGFVTSQQYASGSYEIRAKVPKASGMVWAIWTFAGQQIFADRPESNKGGNLPNFSKSTALSKLWIDQSALPGSDLPQGGQQLINAEIDIEIPANAPQTFDPSQFPLQTVSKYNTMNMNAYRWTNGAGKGVYQNLWAKKESGDFLGDGEYHKYRFDWHTGDDEKGVKPAIHFYFDDAYVGTVDAMVPMIAGRLWATLWQPTNAESTGAWNGMLDKSICSGDAPYEEGHCQYAEVLVDYVKVTPFGEANDTHMSQAFDQPNMNNCGANYMPPCRDADGLTSLIPYYTAEGSEGQHYFINSKYPTVKNWCGTIKLIKSD